MSFFNYGGATVQYTPDALGQPTKAAAGSTQYASNVLFYPNGQLKSFSYGNGQQFTQILDSQFRPEQRLVKQGSTNKVAQRYTYDPNNNIESIINLVDNSKSISLTYDGLDRLNTASGYCGSGNFVYDTLGNLTQKNLGTQQLTYQYHQTSKRLDSVTGGYTFGYDDRGNVINNGKRAFTFNRANQLTNSGTIGYVYDGHNRRVKKNGSNQGYSVYSQNGKLMLTDGANGATSYIYLGKELIAKVGSAAALEDKPGYTGHVEDKDLSLTYMQQRYYDPVIGRFYSNDPVGFSADKPMMFNRYAYGNNNPYKYTDPDGRLSDCLLCRPDYNTRALMKNGSPVRQDPAGKMAEQVQGGREAINSKVESAISAGKDAQTVTESTSDYQTTTKQEIANGASIVSLATTPIPPLSAASGLVAVAFDNSTPNQVGAAASVISMGLAPFSPVASEIVGNIGTVTSAVSVIDNEVKKP